MPIKPIWALLVALFYGALLGGSVWSGSQWKEFQAPDLIETDQQGHLYVRIYNTIQQFDQRGIWQREYALEKIGVTSKHPVGGMGVFTNGDLLLLQGEPARTVKDDFQRFNRAENAGAYQNDANAPSLVRCDSFLVQCRPLEKFARKFKNTFSVYIDDQDNIFLADTAGHAVYWLDSDGNEIASLKTELKYPNDLKRIGNTLWVVNTNYHELMSIDISNRNFGEIKKISILNKTTRAEDEIWPSVAEQTKKYWFVLNNENGMDKGAIYQYDLSGNFIKRLEIPDIDPIAMGKTNQELWVADFRHLRILRLDFQGNVLGVLNNEHLEKLMSAPRDIVNRYSLLEKGLWYLFWVFLAFGVVGAVKLETHYRKENPEKFKAESVMQPSIVDDDTPKPSLKDPNINWITINKGLIGLLYFMMCLSVFLAIFLFNTIGDQKISLLLVIAGMVPFIFLFGFAIVKVRRVAVAAVGPWLLIRDSNNHVVAAKGQDIKYTNMVIMVENRFISYRHGQYGDDQVIFEKVRFLKEISPLLKSGQQLTQKEYWQWLWQHQRSFAVLNALVAALILIILLLVLAKDLL